MNLDEIGSAVVELKTKMDMVLSHLAKINGKVEDVPVLKQRVKELEARPRPTRAVIWLGSIVGFLIIVSEIIARIYPR